MKDRYKKSRFKAVNILWGLILSMTVMISCESDYFYDKREPDFLNNSIYEYLNESGNFTNYVRLIEDLDRKEYLNLTGSITLFVADDDAFKEFFQNNPWNVKNYDQLSLSQKKMLFNYSMIKNAYTLEKLSNYYDGAYLNEGLAMRRYTALTALDSIPFVTKFPSTSYWDAYREKGMYLMKDHTDIPFVFFSPQFLRKTGITDDDFSFVIGGKVREYDDFYVFNSKIIKKDIVCKNGYVNVMEKVLFPPVNMAEYLTTNSQTTIFSNLLERFSAPYYHAEITDVYKQLYPGFTDSIFTKGYFATNGGPTVDPDGNFIPHVLSYNPGWNGYTSSAGATVYSDMATMFVPTDEMMIDYVTNDPVGKLLTERYGSWEGLPNDIVAAFLARHMRNSLVESVPSRFHKMVDGQNYVLPVQRADILTDQSYTAVNGQVYVTNKVYTPVDFISVYAPVLLSKGVRIMDWAINRTESARDGTQFAFYRLYLNSLAGNYGFFVPTDEYLNNYIDPVAFGQAGVQGVLKYWYNEQTSQVDATVYTYSHGVVGDSVDVITGDNSANNFIRNRLWRLLDSHIVLNDITSDGYYITKANDIIKVSDNGQVIQGGYDIDEGKKVNVTRVFHQENGTTYFTDAPIHSAFRSVYATLSDMQKPEFSKFFELLEGVPPTYGNDIRPIFTSRGLDNAVAFFNAYNYTIYAPTNKAIQDALDAGIIKSWDDINALPEPQKKEETLEMVRFLRYHFQDRAVFAGQEATGTYESSTLKLPTDDFPSHWHTTINKYYKIGVKNENGTLVLTTENQKTAKVLLTTGYHNLLAKDYVFNSPTSTSASFRNVDRSGATNLGLFSTSRITTSASAVIHLIDNVLTFK